MNMESEVPVSRVWIGRARYHTPSHNPGSNTQRCEQEHKLGRSENFKHACFPFLKDAAKFGTGCLILRYFLFLSFHPNLPLLATTSGQRQFAEPGNDSGDENTMDQDVPTQVDKSLRIWASDANVK